MADLRERNKNSNDILYHHGILGQRWGVRRYQNRDGTLTDAGRVRNRKKIETKSLDYIKKRKRKEDELLKLTNEELYPVTSFIRNTVNMSINSAFITVGKKWIYTRLGEANRK